MRLNTTYSLAETEKFLKDLDFDRDIKPVIEKYVTLPDNGILCGGALSNVILGLLYNIETPINDVDVFIQDHGLRSKAKLIPLVADTETFELGGYANIFNTYSEYYIENTKKEGKLNITTIALMRGQYDPFNIISSFDINQTRVAIDLKYKVLTYTSHFVYYLAKRQMEIVFPNTPVSSYLRLCKKADELKDFIYCNYEHESKRVSYALCNADPDNFGYVGEYTLQEFSKYLPQLRKYFDLEHVYEVRENKYYYTMIPRVFVEFDEIDTKYEEDILSKSSDTINMSLHIAMHVYNVWYSFKSNNQLRDVIRFIISLPTLHKLISANYNFFDTVNFPRYKLLGLDKVLEEHPQILRIFIDSRKEITVSSLLQLADYLSVANKKIGFMIYGLIEAGTIQYDFNKTLDENIVVLQQAVNNQFKTANQKLVINTIQEILSKDLPSYSWVFDSYHSKLKELVTTHELITEGKTMGHCVGGYSDQVKSGRSRIFHVTMPQKKEVLHATLELGISFDEEEQKFKTHIVQLRSYKNHNLPDQIDKSVRDYIESNIIYTINTHSDVFYKIFNTQIKAYKLSRQNDKHQLHFPFYDFFATTEELISAAA